LKQFVNSLEKALPTDDSWGPVLEGFQNLRYHRSVTKALEERNLAISSLQLASQLGERLTGGVGLLERRRA